MHRLLLVVISVVVAACSGGEEDGVPPDAAPPDAAPLEGCVDLDHDGFGLGPDCTGDDCDDLDPVLAGQCGASELCAAAVHTTGCACDAAAPVPCMTAGEDLSGVGPCHAGLRACDEGIFGPCEGQVLPGVESCNGEDDDCDGESDEDVLSACGDCFPDCKRSGLGVGEDVPFDPHAPASRNVIANPDGSLTLRREISIDNQVIWIANSTEGTISKVETTTEQETGRYVTDPGGLGNPSRSAVDGDASVVSVNRTASTATFIRASDCPDQNGDGVVTTSTGPNDVLPWGEDECVLWNLPIEGGGARGAAIEMRVEPDGSLREYAWVGAACSGDVYEIDVAEGALTGRSVNTRPAIPYGAAIGPDHTLWVTASGWDMAKVDTLTLDVTMYAALREHPFYGITVDADGMVWLAGPGGTSRFDPESETYDVVDGVCGGGVAVDAAGDVWTAHGRFCHPAAVARIDGDTLEVDYVETGLLPYGIAVDFDGMVWVVNGEDRNAFEIDPSDLSFEMVWESHATAGAEGDCLGGPLAPNYTYSDMTGFQLALVAGLDGSYAHVFEGCEEGQRTHWTELGWDADVPAESAITFTGRTADRLEDLAAAPRVVLAEAFPGEGSVPIAAVLGEPGRFLEVTASLLSSPDSRVPTLRSFWVRSSCEVPPE